MSKNTILWSWQARNNSEKCNLRWPWLHTQDWAKTAMPSTLKPIICNCSFNSCYSMKRFLRFFSKGMPLLAHRYRPHLPTLLGGQHILVSQHLLFCVNAESPRLSGIARLCETQRAQSDKTGVIFPVSTLRLHTQCINIFFFFAAFL